MNTVTVATSSNIAEATIWVDALRDAGIRAAAVERGLGGALGGASGILASSYAVLVGEDDFGNARNIIAEMGGASRLAPLPGVGSGLPRAALWMVGGGLVLAVAVALASQLFG